MVRTEAGWREDGAAYSIAALPDGHLMPEGWRVDNFEEVANGFRKKSREDGRDLVLKRVTDDGLLVVVTEWTKHEDAEKTVEVFGDRWVDSMVENPKRGMDGIALQDGRSGLYDDVLPPSSSTVSIHGMPFVSTIPPVFPVPGQPAAPTSVVTTRDVEVEMQSGRRLAATTHDVFPVPGGEGVEEELHAAAEEGPGRAKDLYVAVLRPKALDRIVVVVYSNTRSLFAGAEADVAGLARRFRFP